MRYTDILNEVRMTDGVWTSLTSRDLQTLAAKEDLRGCTVDGRVYGWPAMDMAHFTMRHQLGLSDDFGDAQYGFDWYAYDTTGDNAIDDRDEWVADIHPYNFLVGTIGVSVGGHSADALMIPAFARMVGHRELVEAPMEIKDFAQAFNDPKINSRVQQQAARKNPAWKKSLAASMQKYGFVLVGAGVNGAVFQNPQYPFVLKVYRTDRGYDEWLYFMRTHQNNPHVPKMRGAILRINDIFSAVRLEQLEPCDATLANQFLKPIERGASGPYRDTLDLIASDPAAGEIAKYMRDWEGVSDLSHHNVMMRRNGELVIIDPIYIEPGRDLEW
jgi:hypothetical protein